MASSRVARPWARSLWQYWLLLILLTASSTTPAASIEQIGSSELVAEATLIFQGEVYENRSQVGPDGRIYTFVEFSIVEVLKGQVVGNSLQLRFTGGTVDDVRLDVGVIIPRVGEHGIYFVESTLPTLANPLLGWSQGHFLVSEDNYVTAGDGGTVVDVVAQPGNQDMTLSTGVAAGFTTQPLRRRYGSHDRALTPEEFKAKISQLIDEGPGEGQ